MNTKKTVLIISFSHLERDPRVNRQIRCLATDYDVIAAGLSNPQIEGVGFIPLFSVDKGAWQKIIAGFRLLCGAFEDQYWRHPRIVQALKQLKGLQVDLVMANDIETLPLALKVAKNADTIFDAHEYAPREFEDLLGWNIFYKRFKTYLCKKYLPKVKAMMTVSPGIAKEYQKQFGIASHIITNAPEFAALTPCPMSEGRIRLVCHSYAIPSRKLETLIDMFDHLDNRYEMDLILMPFSETYLEELKKRAAKYSNIRFPPPVPMRDIVPHLNKYDLGVYLLPSNSFNNTYALPNKLFEFIQARLAIAIGPSPEMSAIIDKYQCGITSKDFSPKSLAQAIMSLDNKQIEILKMNACHAAEELCAEKNQLLIREIVLKAMVKA